MCISLFTGAIPVNYNSEFLERYETITSYGLLQEIYWAVVSSLSGLHTRTHLQTRTRLGSPHFAEAV